MLGLKPPISPLIPISWGPDILGPLVCWYRADRSPQMTGEVVTGLQDLSGNGNHLTFGHASMASSLVRFGGYLPPPDYGNSSDYLSGLLATPIACTPFHIFMRVKNVRNPPSTSFGTLLNLRPATTSISANVDGPCINATFGAGGTPTYWSGTVKAQMHSIYTTQGADWTTIDFADDGTSRFDLYVGADHVGHDHGAIAADTANRIGLAGHVGYSSETSLAKAAYSSVGYDLAELLIYASLLTSTPRSLARSYLALWS